MSNLALPLLISMNVLSDSTEILFFFVRKNVNVNILITSKVYYMPVYISSNPTFGLIC